jgi:hypothetical protein
VSTEEYLFYVIVAEDKIIGTERVSVEKNVHIAAINTFAVSEKLYETVEDRLSHGCVVMFTGSGDIVAYRDLDNLKRLAAGFASNLLDTYANYGLYVSIDDVNVRLDLQEVQMLPLCLAANVKFSVVRDGIYYEVRPAKIQAMLATALKKRNSLNEAFVACYTEINAATTETDILKKVNVTFKRTIESELGITIFQVLK